MAYYYSIPIEEMEEELESLRFYPVNLVFRNKPVKEWVYERKLPRSPNHFVRIYTGIQRYGQSAGESRKAGKDAIRIQVIYRDAKGETLVSQTKRVHRVGGWRKNLHKRMDEVATELPQVEFDSRGEPMTLRKKGKNQFWGSRDYPKFKETKPFRAEEIRCCQECDKTTGLTTIQTGTYCYDCLPINLGAEDRSDYRNYLNDLRNYPELKNLSDEQLLARGIDCLALQTANRESFGAEDIIYVSPNEGIDIDAKIETIKNTGQKVARIDWFATPKGNGFGRAEFENFRDWAYKQGAAYIVVESVPESVNFWKWMGFIEPFGLVEPKDEFLATHLGLNTLIYLAESEAEGGQFAAEDNYDATYGKAQAKIRRKLKNKIKKQAIMGTKAGQWSARKSQELKRQYEAACDKKGLSPYKGKKTKSQDNLSKWSKQKWGTASGKKSSTTGEPYFPAKAVAALKDKGLYSKAKQQKKAATKAGKQNARYSDDIRAVVKNYRSETYEEATGVEFSEQNPEKIEADAPPDWRESIITIPQSDSFGYALYRKMSDLTYNQVWRVLEIIDDLNRMSHHHALTKFSSNYVEIWIYSHDSGLVTPKDYHWAEDFNDMIATVDWQMWESETEWDDVDWENEKPVKPKNDWGDDIEWDAEDDWGSLRPETRPEFPTVDAKIASMLRNHSKVNVNGEQGCPRCGHEDLFYRESTGTGTKWYCYGCFYTEKTESMKSQKVITLEKYGLKVRCPDCNEMIVAYNQASVNSHRRKCGVTK